MKVFVSSTFDDLEVHRAHVLDALTRCDIPFRGMESFGASPTPTLDYCLDQIRKCSVFLCILGTRYGSRPNDSELSFVEHEINCAFSEGLEVLLYIIDERRQPVLREFIDSGEDQEALARLKVRVKEKTMSYPFTTPGKLALQVVADLYKLSTVDKSAHPPSLEDPAATNYRENAYDFIAKWYDTWYYNHWRNQEPCNTLLNVISDHFSPSHINLQSLKFLDTACGTGNTFVAFKQKGFEIFGCDASAEMLKRAAVNCGQIELDTHGLVLQPISWTDLAGYRAHLPDGGFDVLLNTANSFCHLPPVPRYMDRALENFRELLKPGGLLIIDTKRYILEGDKGGVPFYKELRCVEPNKWVIRTTREEPRESTDLGAIAFHTRLHYDIDPAFSERVLRALIVLTIHGEELTPQTALIPYYPLPVEELQKRMTAAGFLTKVYPAYEGPAARWMYDIVVGQRPPD